MALLDDAARTARSIAYLAIIPILSTLLAFEKLTRTGMAGPGWGVKFPLPTPLPDLWTFVSVPSTGVTVHLGVPLLVAPVFFVLNAALVAGYVGSIDDAIENREPDFVQSAITYAVPVLGVQVIVFAFSLVSFIPAFAGGMALAPLSAVVGLAVGYLLWAAPIIVVVRDRGILRALSESVSHASTSIRYAAFSLIYLVGGLLASGVITSVVRGRLALLLVTTLLLAYPLLVLSVATVIIVKSLPPTDTPAGQQESGVESDPA